MKLPEQFQKRMREMLGEEYEAFLAGYDNTRKFGLRLNTMRMTTEEFEERCPFPVERLPWIRNGYSYGEGVLPARHPWYTAGVYYLQEPSAMTPADRLPVEPGDRVLDLCAAPGGKATALAAKLRGEGILVANDISASRAKALLRNLELFGTGNVFVTNETPERLAVSFPEYFDKILVDAPCSGEGMFRKSQEVADDWSPEKVEYFAGQQRMILKSAVAMLRPGGLLLYSTCTFSPSENEGSVDWLLQTCPDMKVDRIEPYEGFGCGVPEWIGSDREELRNCVRIWPHRMQGEGHFMALLKKNSGSGMSAQKPIHQDEQSTDPALRKKKKKEVRGSVGKRSGSTGFRNGYTGGFSSEERQVLEQFLKEQGLDEEWPVADLECRNGNVYRKLDLPDTVRGLHFLRNGLYLGECRKGRFEPSQPFALALSPDSVNQTFCLQAGDVRMESYLRGETLNLTEEEINSCGLKKGWILITADGFSVGWGKFSGTVIKNKIPSGWRK